MGFTGKSLNQPKVIRRENFPDEVLHPYIASDNLIKAVNLAIILQRPLLLMGEPGCGKSRLAQAVAYELFHREHPNGDIIQDYKDAYFEWNIKSSSVARDGLYAYDAIQRLGDAQIMDKDHRAQLNKENYIELGAMGLAFQASKSIDNRPVLLIDEVDKADIDFPNDLLNELDKGRFTITETGRTLSAVVKPIVFITSNAEKPLPDAFLRRCLFHYIEPLEEDILTKIIERRFYAEEDPNTSLIKTAVDQFLAIRKKLDQMKLSVGKNVSTSELLDWFQVIKHYTEIAEKGKERSLPSELKLLIEEVESLGKEQVAIPFQQVLFKNWSTIIHFQNEKNG